MSRIKTPIMDMLNNPDEKKVIQSLTSGINNFSFAFNGTVEILAKMVERNASCKDKYEIATMLVQLMTYHLKRDRMDKAERRDCMMILTFYQMLQAIYERGMDEKLVTQEYIDGLAEDYDQKRIAAGIPDTNTNCDFLSVDEKWERHRKEIGG